jgi:hypothetical protein
MLPDRKDEWLAARLEDLDYGYIDGIKAAVRKYPLEGVKKDEAEKELGYFLIRQVQHAGRPWRLTATEYLASPAEGEPFSPFQVPDTPWDPALADAMRHRCERVSEEARLAHLLHDLNRNLIDEKIRDGC